MPDLLTLCCAAAIFSLRAECPGGTNLACESRKVRRDSFPPTSGRQVLLVEDDPDLRETLRAVLEDSGVSVACAANGREALAYLREQEAPFLVLLDLMMPVMNGWEFRAEQMKDAELSRIPVAVLSADSRTAFKAESLGVERYLKKPIQLEELLSLVQSCR